ncbi:uncharacterized protein BO72DRAFT_98468 [Aspergillus fijiensis CBS 313.89]|uniref:Uncharacterized protein n=1 Tax=Aspergillus fijiensis CBS 313.89 TaxID=1448319 RepID=A0A8G1RPK7_9EURO|nr:uncharacterized protein BO72DRAFT_98468 [Aspergillus fijiensis CBS 313.89]RAK77887.1 hypothetical protein BO72DRAFT_98468 [Aspergillus fijiensis CBS 313.89]
MSSFHISNRDVSTRSPRLHLGDELGLLRRGDHIDFHQLIHNLHLTTRQDLQQGQLLARLDQAARDGLHEALHRIDRVLMLRIPGQREDVLQMILDGVHLGERLDEIRLRVHVVQKHTGELEGTFGRQRVRRELDARILHLRGRVRLARADVPGLERHAQQLRLLLPALLLGLPPRRHPLHRGLPLRDLGGHRLQGLVLGVDGQAARRRILRLGDLIQSEQCRRGAVVGLDILGVEFQSGGAIEGRRAVVLCDHPPDQFKSAPLP